MLDGSDWDNIQIIRESGDVYIYKFDKNGKDVWVAWNDNSDTQTITLDVDNINSVKITEATPKYETGKEVADYNTALNTETNKVGSGKAIIILGESPVFIEGE